MLSISHLLALASNTDCFLLETISFLREHWFCCGLFRGKQKISMLTNQVLQGHIGISFFLWWVGSKWVCVRGTCKILTLGCTSNILVYWPPVLSFWMHYFASLGQLACGPKAWLLPPKYFSYQLILVRVCGTNSCVWHYSFSFLLRNRSRYISGFPQTFPAVFLRALSCKYLILECVLWQDPAGQGLLISLLFAPAILC